MSNTMQSQESKHEPRSVSECVADLIRTGKDAQAMLEPLRSFCRFAGCDLTLVDELHDLFEKWDDPSFSALVPRALQLLDKIFEEVDDHIFRENVGEWNIAWYGLYNAVDGQRHPVNLSVQNDNGS